MHVDGKDSPLRRGLVSVPNDYKRGRRDLRTWLKTSLATERLLDDPVCVLASQQKLDCNGLTCFQVRCSIDLSGALSTRKSTRGITPGFEY